MWQEEQRENNHHAGVSIPLQELTLTVIMDYLKQQPIDHTHLSQSGLGSGIAGPELPPQISAVNPTENHY